MSKKESADERWTRVATEALGGNPQLAPHLRQVTAVYARHYDQLVIDYSAEGRGISHADIEVVEDATIAEVQREIGLEEKDIRAILAAMRAAHRDSHRDSQEAHDAFIDRLRMEE